MTDTPEPKKTPEEKMDELLAILHRMDRRDRARMIGSTIRSIIGLIPLVLLLWSSWYLLYHGEEFIQRITEQTVKNTIGISTGKTPSIQDLLKDLGGVKVK